MGGQRLVASEQTIVAVSPRDLIGRISDLPSLPAIYFRVKSIIDNPDSSMTDVEREISYDAGLTSRLLCLANSAYYSVCGKLHTIGQALSILGTEQVKHLLLATSVANAFRGITPVLMDMKKFWLMSAYRALVARFLAKQNRRFDEERSFVEGLLGDIGHLVMYLGIPHTAEEALLRSMQSGEPLQYVEREMLGFDYAEVGAELLSMWNLSPVIEAAVRHHPVPLAAGGTAAGDASILHIATQITNAAFKSGAIESSPRAIDPIVWLEAGLSAECLPDIKTQADEKWKELVLALLPDFLGRSDAGSNMVEERSTIH